MSRTPPGTSNLPVSKLAIVTSPWTWSETSGAAGSAGLLPARNEHSAVAPGTGEPSANGMPKTLEMSAAAIIGTAAPAWAGRTTHTVHPGESIQAAIDASQPGDKIKIKAGTYHENVYVNKDFIEVEGDGAHETTLLPPAVVAPNPCADAS